jgi:hypothetical protein
MLIRELTKFANDLDTSGLKKEADTIDVIIGAIKKLLEERDLDKDLDKTEENQKEVGSGEKEGEEKQVELFGSKTTNFEICSGAVSAFNELKEQLGSSPSDETKEYALEAMNKTDELFQIEKNALNSKAITSRELESATKLYREILYNIGGLSADTGKDLLSNFEFLDGHMDKIKSFEKKKGEDDE